MSALMFIHILYIRQTFIVAFKGILDCNEYKRLVL